MRPLLALALAAGCAGSEDPEPATPASPDLVMTDANNYDFTVDLALATTELAASANATIDWSATTVDFRGRPFAASDVDKVTIAAIGLENDELIAAINLNALQMESILTYYEAAPVGVTSASFDTFTILSVNEFPYETEFVPGFSPTWLVSLWKDNERGLSEILSSQFVAPEDGAPELLTWTDGAADLTFDPALSSESLRTVAEADAWSLDWSAVTEDVNGAAFDPAKGDTLRITHLPVESTTEAEDALLQLDVVATEMYFLDVYGDREVADLAEATSVDGAAFPGFTADGTWLVSIECTQLVCFSPAPLLLAVVEVQ